MAAVAPLRLAPEPGQERGGYAEDERRKLEAALHSYGHLESDL